MWFRIEDLDIEAVPVDYRTPAGICRGIMKYVRRRPEHRLRVGGHQQTVPTDWLHGWRPANADTWPAPLPAAYVQLQPMAFVVPEPSPREPHHEAINPGIRLGYALERPRSRAEAETRYLRWLRTWDYDERHGGRATPAGYGEAWPRQLREDADAVARWARSSRKGVLGVLSASDMDDIYIDSALEIAREQWAPDKRDMSDYDHGRCMFWHAALSRHERRIVAERAKNPPPTFGEIATRYNRDRQWAHRVYSKAIDKIWRAAR